MKNNMSEDYSNDKFVSNGITYSINENEKTAGITLTSTEKNDIIIPRSIMYKSQKYTITSILEEALSFQFIKSLFIPMTIVSLKKGWCRKANKLISIKISPNNPVYTTYENKFIIGKSSPEKEKFDVLEFCVRDIEKVIIPSFIEIIGPFAFEYCHQLRKIEIPSDSKLRIIDECAFYETQIESVILPPHLTRINKKAFYFCEHLQKIEIPTNSELQIIEKNAFTLTIIENIIIPSNLIELHEKWCKSTPNLKNFVVMENNPKYKNFENKLILGKSNLKSLEFDTLVFARRDIETAKIPSYIKQIDSCAFLDCIQLRKVEIPINSELEIIGEQAFSNTSIESINLPPCLTQINDMAFHWCRQLQKVEIPLNSELKLIGKYVFIGSLIERIFIPPHVTKICEQTFSECCKLKRIEIPINSKLKKIEKDAFANTSIQSFFIPNHIKHIDDCGLGRLRQLQILEFDENSEIEYLDLNIFFQCNKTLVMIPVKLSERLNLKQLYAFDK